MLDVRGLTDTDPVGRVQLRDVSFMVTAGEIVGLGGLVGAGRTETALGIFGARPGCSGEVRIDGESIRIRSPRDAVAAGIGYVPEDRKEAGLFLDMGLAANITAAGLRKFGSVWLDDAGQERAAAGFRESLRIAARGGTANRCGT